MTIDQIETILLDYFGEVGILINELNVKGINGRYIDSLYIELYSLSICNILEEITMIINEFENNYNMDIKERYLKF